MGKDKMFPSAVNLGDIQQYMAFKLDMKFNTHSWHFRGPTGLEPNQVGKNETLPTGPFSTVAQTPKTITWNTGSTEHHVEGCKQEPNPLYILGYIPLQLTAVERL
jgi:hypothetical protein